MLDFKSVGDKIHSLRAESGFSQDRLAEMLFVTRQAVSRWELGLTLPSVDNLAELCNLFGVSFEELLCVDRPAQFANGDIFRGHSREFVVKNIIDGTLKINLPDNFYLFSPAERLRILKAVKDRKIICDIKELAVKLTDDEKVYLLGVMKK